MTKIDWYILKKFLLTFIFCLLMFTVIAVAVDSSEKMDDFVKANMGFTEALQQYYLGFVPYIWSLLFPLFVFIAVIFFTSKMATRSEIIAILASGTSYNRLLRAYVVGGILLASLLWVGSRYWIPKANRIRSNFQTRYVDKNDPIKNQTFGNCESCFYLRLDTNTFIGIRSFDSSNKTVRGFFLERIQGNKVVYNLRAETMRWDTATKGWILSNAAERFIDSMGERLTQHAQFNFKLDLDPAELRKDIYMKDKLTTPELIAFIRQEEVRGTEGLNTLRVERYRRTATPAAVLLLTLIGAVIASRRSRGGSGIHMALGIVIAAIFILSDRFSTVFATKGNLPPLLAAWLPNIAFAAIAYWLYRRTPK
ncbi:MAG TPA: LptF/LptG family permease [Chitinophagaceae bacterium]|jgi:lipopolysaccharide export system permease protein|nr:LptF/LptG family permease [Chitinophagaceae bacterium]